MAYRVIDEKPSSGVLAQLRSRLLQFLSLVEVPISAEDILPHLPYDGCFEERAVILSRLKRHRQALTLWVHLLNSWDSALNYCARVQAEIETKAKSEEAAVTELSLHEIYTMLIEICLNPIEPIAIGIILPGTTATHFLVIH